MRRLIFFAEVVVRLAIIAICIVSSIANAQGTNNQNGNISSRNQDVTQVSKIKPSNDTNARQDNVEISISKNTITNNSELINQVEKLEDVVLSQKKQIDILQAKTNQNEDSMTFAVWTGILLASVALIVTVLGVYIAIFSFFGYQKIMASAQEVASEKSAVVAADTAKTVTPNITKIELIKLLDEGKFDETVYEAVEKVVYRGIGINEDKDIQGDLL